MPQSLNSSQDDKIEAQKVSARSNTEHIDYHGEGNIDKILAGGQLGTLTLEVDGKVVLSPTPSDDPNDPLNWSKAYKIYIALAVSLAVFMSNFLAAGPTVSIVKIAIDFTGPPGAGLDIPKTAYLFSTSALMQGVCMLLWLPLCNKIGRRPVYVVCFVFFFLCVIWAALAKTYPQELVARMGIGFFSGGAECLAPITITDLFFTHERGTYMAFYQVFLSIGVSFGIIVSGLVVHGTGNWRDIYWVGAGLVGATTLLVIFTFPETAYRRKAVDETHVFEKNEHGDPEKTAVTPSAATSRVIPPRKSFFQRMALWSGTYTHESFLKMFLRPAGLCVLPAIAWAVLTFSATIGFLVGITSNFAVALGAAPYNFTTLQSSLCFIGGIVGGLIGIPFSGYFGDWIVRRSTHKNDGVREPEMRLPAIYPYIILGPLALILYGVGIDKGLHWMCPTVGLALLMFTIVGATNHAFMYCLDIYKPVASEVTAAIVGFKGIVGFGLSFGTNQWIALQGYDGAFGEMALITAVCLGLAIPLNIWGARIRQASFGWAVTRWVHWDADRDDVQVVFH